ncbi:translation initiation factor IF-2-like isoform X2 [Tripterygium wilfordii]|uniref:translation initiation factor IF-2-like isoform X2 n=1 Tax=Tripterygium wilfordii TaxID=458696 RepID=UPI0018F806CE|nr:translation initiation factor IF-2-like isoform X2 [Tripterygium wilfordii]
MYNRSSLRESQVGGRNVPGTGSQKQQHRRGQSLTFPSKDTDENLDLFSKNLRGLSVASSDVSSDVSVKLGRLSVGSAKLARSGIEDLLSSAEGEGGKHDYDWLLTPPGTPQCEAQSTVVAPRSSAMSRSVSATKASRLSVSQSESNHSTRPARSSSVTRPSVSTSQFSSYSSSRSSNILNTSSASVSSYTRPSSPITRSPSTARPSSPITRSPSTARPSSPITRSPSTARPLTPSARSTPSRSSTPSRIRANSPSSSVDKTRPSANSRPSTPSSRPHIPANLNSASARSNSRPSTPTRRNPAPPLSPAAGSSAGRVLSNGRNPGPSSRSSSPSPRVRAPQQPVVPPDFPLDTPPNLRTTLPDRPLSAGRSRPGAAVTVKGSPEPTAPANMPRRHSSPIVARGRLIEPPGRGRVQANGHVEPRKALHTSELPMRKPVKSSTTTTENTGFGRTISKKSLDMAIRHMDIRNGTGGVRSLSGTTLFPQSVRSAAPKSQSARFLESCNYDGSMENGDISENGSHSSRHSESGNGADNGRYSAIDDCSRYDAILLKEDSKNTSWLHSVDDDQASVFDHGFEPPPEPFGMS